MLLEVSVMQAQTKIGAVVQQSMVFSKKYMWLSIVTWHVFNEYRDL